MADLKISALPASTTPLAGTEVLPIVQSSATKQVSVANLTDGRAISATQLTLTTGNLIVASGQGIDFSATPGIGTSELLNDYEEGTWTPADGSGASLSFTFGVTSYYTKIGNVVTCNMDVIFPVTVSTSVARITLPFAPKVNGAGGNIGYTTKTGGMYLSLSAGGSFVFTDLLSNFLTNANMSTTQSQFSFSYIAV